MLNWMIKMSIEKFIKGHEGTKLYPYTDTVGKITIGTGHNLSDNGISEEISNLLLKDDIAIAQDALKGIFKNFNELPLNIQYALTDMMFNMGEPRFRGFKKMIAAIKAGDFKEAALQAKDSRWCKQVGKRCEDDYKLISSTVTSK